MITLIQLSDCHLLKDKNKTGYAGIAPYKSLARVLSSVREYVVDSVDIKNYVAQKAASEPEQRAKHQVIVLVTGDISGDNSPESYEHFIALMEQYIEPANIEWFVLAGNHDNNPYFEKYLSSRYLKSNDPISFPNWQIHGLDTRAITNKQTAAGEVKESDIQALEQALIRSPQANHLVNRRTSTSESCHSRPCAFAIAPANRSEQNAFLRKPIYLLAMGNASRIRC